MFVIIICSIGCKPFSLFSHKHKKIVNFICSCGGSGLPMLQTRKLTIARERFSFLV